MLEYTCLEWHLDSEEEFSEHADSAVFESALNGMAADNWQLGAVYTVHDRAGAEIVRAVFSRVRRG